MAHAKESVYESKYDKVALRVQLGSQKFYLSQQEKRKELAYEIIIEDTVYMIIEIDITVRHIY